MKRIILVLSLFLLVVPLVFSASCRIPSQSELVCEREDCVFSLSKPVSMGLLISEDNVGLEGSLVKFYLHEVGKSNDCISQGDCIERKTSGVFVRDGKAIVDFSPLGSVNDYEVSVVLIDGTSRIKGITIQPTLDVFLSYDVNHLTGQYVVGELASVNVRIVEGLRDQRVVNPKKVQCSFFVGGVDVTDSLESFVCNQDVVSFVPLSTGTYTVQLVADFDGQDLFGNPIVYSSGLGSVTLDVLLPQQDIKLLLDGKNINDYERTASGGIKVDLKSYNFRVVSSEGSRGHRLVDWVVEFVEPDASVVSRPVFESKCGVNDGECVYSFSYEFKKLGDTYGFGASSVNPVTDRGYSWDYDFVTIGDDTVSKVVSSNFPFIIGGIIIGVLFFVGIILLIVNSRK